MQPHHGEHQPEQRQQAANGSKAAEAAAQDCCDDLQTFKIPASMQHGVATALSAVCVRLPQRISAASNYDGIAQKCAEHAVHASQYGMPDKWHQMMLLCDLHRNQPFAGPVSCRRIAAALI